MQHQKEVASISNALRTLSLNNEAPHSIPLDILLWHILLPHVINKPYHVTTLSLVCKQWRQLLCKHEERVWKHLWVERWPHVGRVVDVSLLENSLEFSLMNEIDSTHVDKVELAPYLCNCDLVALDQRLRERLSANSDLRAVVMRIKWPIVENWYYEGIPRLDLHALEYQESVVVVSVTCQGEELITRRKK